MSAAEVMNSPPVRDLMSVNVRTIQPETPIAQAAKIMGAHGIRHLVVTGANGKPVGVVTERDILKRIAQLLSKGRLFPHRLPARELMVPNPITVTPDTSIHYAASLLAAYRIGCLPVVAEGGDLVGILTTVDALRFLGECDSSA